MSETRKGTRDGDAAQRIGLVGATAIGIGGMVGGGIFAVLGVAATEAGGATPFAFLFGGLIAAVTAFSYSKLSVEYQSAGGTVTFVDRVFGVGVLTGTLNILLWTGYVATTALYASAFGNYAATLLPGGTDPSPVLLRVLIAAGVALPWFINLASAGIVSKSEGIVVAIKLTILVVVIIAGVPAIEGERLATSTWPSAMAILSAGMLIFVAYEGFELIANASADVKRPPKTLPRAFALSVGIVIVLYVAIATVVVGSLSPQQIEKSADFALAEAASASLGQVGFTLVAAAAVLATFSAINATLYGSARLSYTIATEGELPERLTTKEFGQPVGLHVTAALGLILAIGLPLTSISALSSAIFLTVFAVVNATAYRAFSRRRATRALAAAGVIACLGSLVVLLTQSYSDDRASLLVLGVLVTVALFIEHGVLKPRRPHEIKL